MLNSIKCAVIGVGNMGKNHARVYEELKSVSLCAVSDLDEDVGINVAREFGVKYYNDYQEMIKKEKPDIVSICVPTRMHFTVASFCMHRRIHVLLEKPIAISCDEAEQLLKLSKKMKITFLVGHIERFNPAVRKVKEMIDNGELGKITAMIFRRVGGFPPQIRDANIAVDLAIHDVDIANYILCDLPINVECNMKRNHIKKREDSVEFFLQYKQSSAYIQANWITPVKIRKLNITGTEGYLEMDYVTQKIQFFKSNYDKFKEKTDGFSDYVMRFSDPDIVNISVAKKEPLKEEINYFIECVKNNTKINSKFALDALKIVLN